VSFPVFIAPGFGRCRLAPLFVLACSSHALCADSVVPLVAGSARLQVRVTSLRAMRDAGVVKQRYDYSCGAASLATLLTYGLNDPVGEEGLLRALLDPLSPDQIRALQQNGLSLFDLQRLARERGHDAQGFRLAGSQLARLPYPVIVFIKPRGYRHFAVLKGVRGGRAWLADPTLGNVRMPLYRFLDMWADESGKGVIFAVERPDASWPERFALELRAGISPPLETLSAARMIEIGKPLPGARPGR
jgi:predicted double-glycine peptidase